MSTSEIEPSRIDLKNKNKLNGWWRLWIVLSIVWVSGILYKTTKEYLEYGLNNEIATNQYSIYGELDSKNKSLIFESEEQANGSVIQKVKIQNHNNIILFKSNVQEEQRREFVISYCNIGRSIQLERRKSYILFGLGLLCFPPTILLISGKTIAWIINGFKS